MPYITIMQTPAFHQLTFEEVLSGNVDLSRIGLISSNSGNTRTYFAKELDRRFVKKFDINAMTLALRRFVDGHATLYAVDRHSLYQKFYIPKKSGGLREINAPVPQLMAALRELKTLFEGPLMARYHTTAFAYVPGRSTIDAVKRHQGNGSHWFLKTDFSDFFGSTTPEFLIQQLSMIFPFSEIVRTMAGKLALTEALDLCFLDGGLPQGTPISPMLTNLMMIPVDHRLSNCLRKYHDQTFVYTRYADDILISSKRGFDHKQIVGFINDTLREFHAPFQIKDAKTRYGSRAGSNWNLGIMLNKDNQMTVGWKNKRRFHAMLCNYILDRQNGKPWELHDVQVLSGLMNYYRMVERDFVDRAVKFNNEKFQTDVLASLHEDLSV